MWECKIDGCDNTRYRQNPGFCIKHHKEKKGIHKITCKWCGKKFDKKTMNNVFCSKKCGPAFFKSEYKKNKKITHFEIFKRDNFRCQYCGKKPADGIKLVVDHIYPLSKGGKEDRFNLLTACRPCNSSKGSVLLPKDIIVDFWESNENKFTYKQAKDFWKKERKRRVRNLSPKNKSANA